MPANQKGILCFIRPAADCSFSTLHNLPLPSLLVKTILTLKVHMLAAAPGMELPLCYAVPSVSTKPQHELLYIHPIHLMRITPWCRRVGSWCNS